jgi:hypothetical protein
MAASSKLMITEAERRFPVRIKLALPARGLGERLNKMHAWLDENCGADGWAMTPAGMRGVVNDAVAVYFLHTVDAAAFVARWCIGRVPETVEGAFRVRDDAPIPRPRAADHTAATISIGERGHRAEGRPATPLAVPAIGDQECHEN